ncbi:MAG: DUF305 domain-containing protein [Thermoleophilia bacterium]
MTRRFWTILVVVGVLALGAGVGIGAAVWAGGDHGTTSDSGTMMGGGAMDGAMALDEQGFLVAMVPHHQSAVDMATLALVRTERPEIRSLARDIIAAQEEEISEMQAWHRQWFGEELRTSDAATQGSMNGMSHGGTDMGDLEKLEGDEFDLAFLSMMIPHHASAIMMAESVLMSSPRGQVVVLAEDIIATQAAEIGQMQRWRGEWFPRG